MVPGYQIPIQYQTAVKQADPPFGPEVHRPSHQRGRAQQLLSPPTRPRFFAVPNFHTPSAHTRPTAGSTPHPPAAAPRLTTAHTAAPCLQSAPSARSPPSFPPPAPPVRTPSPAAAAPHPSPAGAALTPLECDPRHLPVGEAHSPPPPHCSPFSVEQQAMVERP